MGFAGANNAEMSVSYNSVSRVVASSAATSWNNNNSARIGARMANSYYFNGPIAFGLMSSAYFSSAQTAALYTLYKSNLGIGLDLP
jgi:hypothetical protein